jgi:hypothetical protein
LGRITKICKLKMEGIVGSREAGEASMLMGDEDDGDPEGGTEDEDGEEEKEGNDGVDHDTDEDCNPLMH